jgi:hypothetical protein
VSGRKPRALCCAHQPRSIASTIATSGRSCARPSMSSERAGPASQLGSRLEITDDRVGGEPQLFAKDFG